MSTSLRHISLFKILPHEPQILWQLLVNGKNSDGHGKLTYIGSLGTFNRNIRCIAQGARASATHHCHNNVNLSNVYEP